MRIMDRYLFANFVIAYAICFSSMVGLYVVIDLFSNADEFIEDHAGTIAFVRRATKYYVLHSFEYYNRLSPIITQIAAMVTLAALHRHNEIVALLAAGVPTKRALVPIIFGAGCMIGFGVINRELILPRYSEPLQRLHEDIEANRDLLPTSHFDRDHVLIRGETAHREDKRIEKFNVTLPLELGVHPPELRSSVAYWRQDEKTGRWGWLLIKPDPLPTVKKTAEGEEEKVRILPDGNAFLFTDISFGDMIRRRNWMGFAGTWELLAELQRGEIKDPRKVRIIIHNRLMQPILNLLLVLIGIPFVLQWERKNIYRSIFVSMIISALFFVIDACSGYFASHGYIDPLSAAWIPVFLFGPVALGLFTRIGT
ncbi:putative permease YjgP/YjgQ family protein [Planctomycetes bacterium Pan216]|uniref:Putative permease YjgP/YjgQ family protein n=1 Tax=Kolteria novifilia TaxID=2527975 RepID=A0A518BB53_9BACT|nr:putative permease YjgP/YjgQ family protein [Planctomycetes bacterium Pan216]